MKSKPFPWMCAGCRERAVYPTTMDYETTFEHDGRPYAIKVPSLEVPCCRRCGKKVITDAVNRAVSAGLRREAGLLMPAQIRRNREELGLTQKQLSSRLGVAEATLSRWETGAQIQQRSMDRLLRIFFAFDPVRLALADKRCVGALGVTVGGVPSRPSRRGSTSPRANGRQS